MKTYSRAPVRFDPAGGGTDAPPYSTEYGGCIVNISVARYIYADFEVLANGEGVNIHSHDLDESVHAESVEALQADGTLDLLKAYVKRIVPAGTACRLATQSDIPARTGLGGSGALGVAVVAAITRALGQDLDRAAIAELANDIERVDFGSAGGNQDSYGAAYPGAKQIICHQGGGTGCEEIPLARATAAQLERNTLLVYTGAIHLSGTIHADIKHSYELPNSPTIAAMDRLKEQAHRCADALRNGDLATYVDAMNISRVNHYALHPSCDSDELRRYFAALDPHILGGKACGAGGGGFIAVYTKPGNRFECKQAAEALGGLVWPLTLDRDGVVAW
jgi:D-glycero-alpha-D-manno-heptose-7-phosphate kinase